MKKIFLISLLTLFIIGLSACIPTSDPDPDPDKDPTPVETTNSGLGRSVNIVLADNYNDFIEGYSVLDSSKVSDIQVRTTNEEDTYIEEFSSTSMRDLKSSTDVGFSFGFGVEGQYNGMFAGISSDFKSSSSFSYSSYSSQYFYVYEKSVLKNRMYFQDYLENEYDTMLSSGYLNALSALSNGTMDYTDFFDQYGSHLIVSAYYGGKLNAYYSIVTNSTTIDSSTASELQQTAKAGVVGVGSTEASVSSSFAQSLGVSTEEIETSFTAKAIGGGTFVGSSLEDFQSSQATWSESFNSDDSYVLMDYADDGLIGLWDILPVEYSTLKSEMISEFQTYYNDNIENMLLEFNNTNDIVTTTHYNSADVGIGARNVQDDGLYGMYDTLESSDKLNLTPLMNYADENYIFRFDIVLHMNEIDSGYQEVWLYNDHVESTRTSSTTVTRGDAASNGMVNGFDTISYGGATKKTVAGYETLTLFCSGEDINSEMYIKYDAHGENSDTWKLHSSDITITAYPVTEVLTNETDKTIIDSGSAGLAAANNQHTDTLDFSSYTGELTENYVYTIILSVNMKQIDNGYQGFYLFDNNTETIEGVQDLQTEISKGLLATLHDLEYPTFWSLLEYGYEEIDTSLSVVYIPLQVRGDQLQETMYLRYDAMGEDDDDWFISDISAYVFQTDVSE